MLCGGVLASDSDHGTIYHGTPRLVSLCRDACAHSVSRAVRKQVVVMCTSWPAVQRPVKLREEEKKEKKAGRRPSLRNLFASAVREPLVRVVNSAHHPQIVDFSNRRW